MFEHKKELLHEVKVERPNPQYALSPAPQTEINSTESIFNEVQQ